MKQVEMIETFDDLAEAFNSGKMPENAELTIEKGCIRLKYSDLYFLSDNLRSKGTEFLFWCVAKTLNVSPDSISGQTVADSLESLLGDGGDADRV